MITVNIVLDIVTLACVAGVAIGAWHREREHHRAVGRQLDELPGLIKAAYAEGFLDAMEDRPKGPAERLSDPDSPTSPLLWINPGRRIPSDLHIRRSFRAVESGR